MIGCRVFLKLENMRHTGSFKDRGALNKMLLLNEQQRARGVVAASAGNHAQAVAYAAQLLGLEAIVVMPETVPLTKLQGTCRLGARVVLHGGGFDEAYARATELAREESRTFIPAFDDHDVISGQGTVGLELLEQIPDLDAVVVPVGGGGLLAGVASAVKARRPEVRVVGVQTERLPSMKESLAAGRIIALRSVRSLADGIAIPKVGAQSFPIVKKHVREVVTVTENETASAIMTLLEQEKVLAEGAGAVSIAALANQRVIGVEGKTVAAVISGGNMDMSLLSLVLEHGLEADGRLAHLRVVVPDQPGSIASLAAAVAGQRANILHIFQDRHIGEVELGEIEVELSLETQSHEHVEAIVNSIRDLGFSLAPPRSNALRHA